MSDAHPAVGEGPAEGAVTEPFRVRFTPGVTPDKWLRTWAARMPGSPVEARIAEEDDLADELRRGACSMAFVRLPVDRTGLHIIPLYEEAPVVVAAKEHPVAAFEEIDVADLADENLLQDAGEVPEWRAVATDRPRPALAPMSAREAVAVAAAGSGVLIVPLSVARLYHRKDVVHRPVSGVAGSVVGLAWRAEDEDPRIETFVGIVRGRTERSSRGGTGTDQRSPDRGDGGRQDGRAARGAQRPGRVGRGGGRPSGGRGGRGGQAGGGQAGGGRAGGGRAGGGRRRGRPR